MAGLFVTPKTPSIPVVTPAASDDETIEREARLKTMLRRRRGRIDTIATSERGVLGDDSFAPRRKRLLGE